MEDSNKVTTFSISKRDLSLFLKSFFSSLDGCSVGSIDGIMTAVIPITSDENTQINSINLQMIKKYNEFIRTKYNKDPKFFDRNIVYESEIKDNKFFIRWS